MDSHDRGRRAFDLVTAAAVAVLTSLFPLTSSDLWWHLAAGREIWRRGGIPLTDPFSFASDRGMWLDHGWLFQSIAYPLHFAGGVAALQIAQVLLAFGIAAVILRHLTRAGVARGWALLVITVTMAAAKPRLTLRPELVTMFFLVLFLTWLQRCSSERRVFAIASLALVWTNMHPGVMVGGLVLLVWCVGELLRTRDIRGPATLLAAFCVPLVITPYGIKSVLFPFRLRALVESGGFTNTEWLPATFSRMPLLYLLIAGGIAITVATWPRADASRLTRLVIAAILACLALRYQRNVGVFAVALPLLLAPEIASCSRSKPRLATAAAAAVAAYSLFTFQSLGAGVNRREIAADAIDFVQQAGVRGNMFNQARFGGYLIWRLYPPQKVMLDGRNEVYTSLLPRLARDGADERRWRTLLGQYGVEWAIIGYNNPPQRVVSVRRDGTREIRLFPFGYLHFPPRQWAVVYWDNVAMVVVRRGGLNAHLERDAPQYLWPEDPDFAAAQIRSGAWPRQAIARELASAIQRRPNVDRAYTFADVVRAQ